MANFIDGVIHPGSGGTEYELYADTTQFIPYWKAENSPNPGTGGISMYVRYRTIPESFPVPSVGDMTITKSGVVLRVTSVTSTEVHYEVVGGVTTDDTLELKGVAADAKTVGDELGNRIALSEVAPIFSASTAYVAGSYVFYNGNLYRFTVNHPAGAWNAGHVVQVVLADDISEIKDSISDLQNNTGAGLYGVKWDRLTNQMTRIAQAEGITTTTTNFGHFGSVNANYDNPFDKIYPWSDMFVCDVDLTKYKTGNYALKECITAVYGDPDFTYIGSATNFVGRYRPEFWYKNEEDSDGNVYFYVSQFERLGFIHSEEAIDGVGFCVDVGDNKVSAGSGVPLTNIAVSTIHSRAKACGFTLQDIYDIDAQIVLYLVEYANMNSQAAVGDGCSNCYRQNESDVISNVSTSDGKTSFTVTDSALSTSIYKGSQLSFGTSVGAVTYKGIVESFSVSGSTYTITLDRSLAITNGLYMSVHGFSACEFDIVEQSVGNDSGYIGTNSRANAYYRGSILWANRYQYILGIYRQQNTNHLWICPPGVNPDNYDALNTSVHQDTGVALPDVTAAWLTVGGNAQVIPGLGAFLATGTSSGSSSSPVGDQQYVPAITADNTILLFGCLAYAGWFCGVFGGAWTSGAGYSNWYDAGRPVLKKSL